MDEQIKKELGELLTKMSEMNPLCDEYSKLHKLATGLADRAIELEKVTSQIKLEELRQDGIIIKSEKEKEIEKIRVTIPKTKIALELARTMLPAILQAGVFVWAIGVTGRFEETGRYTSTLSRMVHANFPKIK